MSGTRRHDVLDHAVILITYLLNGSVFGRGLRSLASLVLSAGLFHIGFRRKQRVSVLGIRGFGRGLRGGGGSGRSRDRRKSDSGGCDNRKGKLFKHEIPPWGLKCTGGPMGNSAVRAPHSARLLGLLCHAPRGMTEPDDLFRGEAMQKTGNPFRVVPGRHLQGVPFHRNRPCHRRCY